MKMNKGNCAGCLCRQCPMAKSCGLIYCDGEGPNEYCSGVGGVEQCATLAALIASMEDEQHA
jgi:hypothetical protein